jgi:5-methyltetrahydropteroyltriglutamate--homocysteine methyltransferase
MKLAVATTTATLGFPRMGPKRELKFALEKYWKGDSDEATLLATAQVIETAGWDLQKQASIDVITVGDHYLYDMVLAWCENLGLCPKRFRHLPPGLGRLFAMARGIDGSEALSKSHTHTHFVSTASFNNFS